MWWVKLLYLAVVIGLGIFSVLYIDSLAVVFFLCALLFPVILLFCLLWGRLCTHASLNSTTASCTVHDSVPMGIIIENTSPFYFPKVYAQITVCHALSDMPEKIRLRFPLHARNTTRLTFYVRPECCGAVKIRIDYLHILDYLHIFRTEMRRVNDELELLVLPRQADLSLRMTAEAVYSPESSRYADRPGDDPSEIFNIREYHPGDAVSRIHWKLSSKSEKLFIREFGYPIEKQVLLLAEYLSDAQDEPLAHMRQAQTFLTLIYSLARRLAEEDFQAVFAWYDGTRLVVRPLQSATALPELFREFYHALDSMTLEPQALRELFAGQHYSSVTLLTNDQEAALLPVLETQADASRKNFVLLAEEKISLRSDSVSVRTVLPEQPAADMAGLIL